jgi:hypothetical protein
VDAERAGAGAAPRGTLERGLAALDSVRRWLTARALPAPPPLVGAPALGFGSVPIAFEIPGYPGILLRASPHLGRRGEGTRVELLARGTAAGPLPPLEGWEVRVTPADAPDPVLGTTDAHGIAFLERLAPTALAGAQVEVRPPPPPVPAPSP